MIRKRAIGLEKNLTSEYSCLICNDTKWVEGEKGVKYCECIIKDISSRQWKSFGVNPSSIKKINEFTIYNKNQQKAKEIALEYVNNFSNIKKQSINSLGILGQSGSGKTHLVVAIGSALINKGYKVIYMPYLEAIMELKTNVLNRDLYLEMTSRYKTADLLIIDDLFKDKLKNGKLEKERQLSESDIKHVYSIINYRYMNNLPIIISSEASPYTLLELDEGISGRLLEKMANRIVVFEGIESDYRLKRWKIQ